MSTTTDPTTTAPTATAPSIAVPETDRPHPTAPRPRRRRLVTGLALATLAATGGTVWVVTGGGGDAGSAPVEIVEDGRWGGPDVYEHSRPAPEGTATGGQEFGSADAAERQTAPETARADGQQYGSADAAEGWTLP